MARPARQPGQRTLFGFDFGTKSIGIAVGQEITGTASPLLALPARDGQPDWGRLESLVKEWQPDLLVVGLPLNMDGSDQPLTDRARKFGNRLHGRLGLPIAYSDERLTTAAARESLFAQGGYRALNKGKVDCQSAVLILESWFERGGNA